MTQSKPVKKKKKTKSDKPKNEEKKAELTRPSTPVDKRKIAAENLREMIKEAHKMHKNHTRSLKGLSAPTSRDTIGKPRESEKAAAVRSNEGRYLKIEMTKRSSKTTKGGIEENTSSIQMKTRRKLSEEIPKKEGPSRKGSTEFGRKIEVVSGRRGSAEFERKKKEEEIPRGGSAVFPAKKRVDIAQRQGSAEFPVRKKDGEKARESSRKRRESLLKIKDYQVGSFVSLELLDKMKCHESDVCVRSRKSILRQSRQDTRKPSETSGGTVKKSKKEGKRKKDDGVSEKKSSSHKSTGEKKRKVKKGTSPKRGKVDSESAPVKREPRVMSQTKSVISSPKSASSNLESNISSITGGGDLFSSNTSRSYFSSESDISKIDKKFMQILEAVTQTKIGFEERAKQIAAEQMNAANLPSTSKNDGEEVRKRRPSELEQKLRDRISYLEQKLEKSKPSEEDAAEKKKQPEDIEKGDVTNKAGVTQAPTNEDKSDSQRPIVVDKKPKDETASKSYAKYEGPTIKEAAQLLKPIRKKREPVTLVKPAKTTEDGKERGSEGIRQETATKKRVRDDSKQDEKEVPEKVGEGAEAGGEGENNVYKRVETWSIIKRLEKAFQTLGLNLEDLDNSDEEEEETSAKKKQRVKKHESSGQEKRVLPQSETLRRWQEAAQASASSTKKRAHASGDTPFAVETNGSGDKNTEYKRVRNSRKADDLTRPPQEKKSKDKTQKEAYYASVTLTPGVKICEGYDLNGLPDGKHVETVKSRSSRKRSGEGAKHTAEHGIISKKSRPNAEEPRSSKRYRKRPHTTNLDDWSMGYGKSKSDHSLSVSCSASSLSEEESKKRHKRKKKNHSLLREPYTRDEEVWTNTNGKGDATSQPMMRCAMKMDREVQSDWKLSSEKMKKENGVQATTNKTHKILKMEAESDELELRQIRQRHRQIISEIKLSLEEIKKQHNLCTKLRRQTKQFNRDCHAKRRMLASYLRDVETSYERRNGRQAAREVSSRHSRALSTDSYYYNKQKNKKIRGKHSDCDMEMVRHSKYGRDETRDEYDMDEIVFSMSETDNETTTISEVVSSVLLTHTSTELALTDTAEESYRSMTSSLRTVCRKYRPKQETTSGITSMEMLCLQWEGDDKLNFSEDGVKQAPGHLVQLLQKLNKIIVTEKNQLEDLVVKASASSNRSTQSNKTKPSISAKSSGSSLHKEPHHKSTGLTRPATTDNEMGASNVCGGGSRQHKSKGNKKTGRDKSPDIEEGIPISRSRSYIRGDPGGRSFDSLLDQDPTITESIGHRADNIQQSGTSCIHLDKHAEENRYRKGDPSFRSYAHILQHLGEHSRHCTEKVEEEDDDAWKRKLEVDRLLRVNERVFKRTTAFGRDTDTHALDCDPYIPSRSRQVSHGRHRQQSIIIDHNRGEENEESQTVLGHASRHSGVTFGLRKHDRRSPHEYLKPERKTDSSQVGRHHEKKGKKHLEEIPINYCEISVNTPGSSSSRLRDAYCQTDNVDDYDDIGDMYLLEESGSSPSFN